MQSYPPLASPVVFVAGSLRSGSTLMSLMLDRHPGIRDPGEFDFLFDGLGIDAGVSGAQALGSHGLDKFLGDDRIYLLHGRRMPPGDDVVQRLRAYVDGVAGSGRSGWLALNIHRNFLSAHELFPEARFLHLVRDPRDCAASSIGMGWAGNVFFGAQPWVDAEDSWDRLRPRLAPGQALELHFEDLVTRPQETLTQVCSFLGLAYDPRMIDLSGTTYEPPSAAFAGQWRRKLSAREIGLVEARVGTRQLVARGYEPLYPNAPAIGGLAKLRLKLQDAAYRHRHRITHYGSWLWLQELLARRFGHSMRLQQVRHRMMAIDAQHLK